jgi:hypothetical protein
LIISSTRCAKNGYELWKLANAGKSKLKLGFDKRKEENEKTKRSAKPNKAADRFSIRKNQKMVKPTRVKVGNDAESADHG